MKLQTKIEHRLSLILGCFIAIVGFAHADYPASVTALNPVGYWRFDETGSSPPLNRVINRSSLGSVIDAAVILDAEKGQPGAVGKSVRFKNPGVNAGYLGSKLDVPHNNALNKSGAFSVEFWIKPAALGADTTGMSILSSVMNDFAASSRRGYLVYMNNLGRIEFRLGNSAGYVGTVNNAARPSLNAGLDKWRHVVCTFDGAKTSVIIDGDLASSKTLTATEVASLEVNTQMPFRMGGTGFNGTLSDSPAVASGGISGNRGIDAWVDEVAYYPFSLSTAQCKAHFTAGTTNPDEYGALILAEGPAGYWPMDDAATSTPDAKNFPIVKNSGNAGATADGVLFWGGLANQPGAGYLGFGGSNRSIALDGANGFVEIGADPKLDIIGEVTLMAWVKPTVKNFFRDIIARGWDGKNAETFLRISRGTDLTGTGYGTTNHYEIGVTDGSSYYDSVLFPMPEGDLNNWVFLAGTYDGSQWTLYRNGKNVGSLTSGNGAIITTNAWTIGAQAEADRGGAFKTPGGISTFFGGAVDEPAIFNKALSAAQIKALYDVAQVSPIITRSIGTPDGYLRNTWPTLFKGGSVTLKVEAEGAEPLTYFWTLDGVPLNAASSSLTLNNLQVGTPTYSVVVANAFGSVTNSVKLSIAATAPTFISQPVPVARFAGRPFTFAVITGGTTPQTFQWKVNGEIIAGATAASYTGTTELARNGASFTCEVTNEAGSSSSAAGILYASPTPINYPAAVLDASPIAYWRLGETNGSVAFDHAGDNNGVYSKITLNQSGYSELDSNPSVLFAGSGSFVGQINGSKINFQGTNVSFTIECWAKAAEGLVDESTLIAKGTGAEGTTGNEQFSLDIASGHYRFFTRGNNNTLYSAEADVGPDNSWQHIVGVYDQSTPDSPQLRVYVNGRLAGTGDGRPANNNGVRPSTSPISIGSKRLSNSPDYDGTFKGAIDEVAIYDTLLSDSVIEKHYGISYGSTTPPQITGQPASFTNYVTLGSTLAVNAFGSIPITYQWKKKGIDIPGATASRLILTGLTLADAGNYTVVITNPAGTTTSAVASLVVLPAPTTEPSIPGLVVHLPFNNSLIDATGRGNNAVALAQTSTSSNLTAATFTEGKVGRAVSYASDFGQPGKPGVTTTTNTSYLSLGVRPDLKFGTNVNFTVAFWIRLPQDFIAGDLPFFTTTTGSLGGSGIVLSPAYGYGIGSGAEPDPAPLNYGAWGVSLYDTNSTSGARIYGDIGSINDGAWHHLAYTFDRAAQVVTYLDGAPARSFKISGTTTAVAKSIDTGLPVTLGQDPTGLYQETGSGDIDELGVWRRVLTPLEVGTLYMAGSNNLGFSGATEAPLLKMTIQRSGDLLLLVWEGGQLQSANSLAGPFSDILPAVSPFKVTDTTAAKFYRLR